jgi:hypothetical protein
VTVGQATAASMYATFPAPPTITSVSSEVHILPSSWTGPPLVPFDTTGWDATPQVQQDGTVYVDFWQLADPFGEEICPLVEEMPIPSTSHRRCSCRACPATPTRGPSSARSTRGGACA